MAIECRVPEIKCTFMKTNNVCKHQGYCGEQLWFPFVEDDMKQDDDVTKDELIVKQQLQIEKQLKILSANKKAVDKVCSLLVCIGGPLNDNRMEFTEKQMEVLKEIADLLDCNNPNVPWETGFYE